MDDPSGQIHYHLCVEEQYMQHRILHGAEYNPDQWLDDPEVLEQDIALMREARIDTVTLGTFSWALLEPEEGVYSFEWMDEVMERLERAGIRVILATPSGARPRWLAYKYPEVLRVGPDRRRRLFGERHNHCFTSPVFRQKVYELDRRLAERYGRRDHVILWHISNEFSGECHCDLCQEAFRRWLYDRYEGDLEALNRAWWTAFWSHRYTRWEEIASPSPLGEPNLHGLNLDWRRFVTHQTVEFMLVEVRALRDGGSSLPVTTNLMGFQRDLDYFRLASHLDVVSWDSYPLWHGRGTETPRVASGDLDHNWDPAGRDWVLASGVAWAHALHRSLGGGKPFLLMESTPSHTNWQPWSKPKRPGMHVLSSLHAVAHGADSVQYFQWRAGRGGSEKFHGAVMYHDRRTDSRVFQEVRELGGVLERLAEVKGSRVEAEVAVVFDWENRWAMEDAQGPRNDGRLDYVEECWRWFDAWHRRGVGCDVLHPEGDWSAYRVVIAPLWYMVKEEWAERVRGFVEGGGVFVTTVWSGVVEEHDLCHVGGFPGPLRGLVGVRSREVDVLVEGEVRQVAGVWGVCEGRLLCDVLAVEDEGVEVRAVYGNGFYAGSPAATRVRRGEGWAYYVGTLPAQQGIDCLVGELMEEAGVVPALRVVPEGVDVSVRVGEDGTRYLWLLNFREHPVVVDLSEGTWRDMVEEGERRGALILPGYGYVVLKS